MYKTQNGSKFSASNAQRVCALSLPLYPPAGLSGLRVRDIYSLVPRNYE